MENAPALSPAKTGNAITSTATKVSIKEASFFIIRLLS
jgi:hypothetical protein